MSQLVGFEDSLFVAPLEVVIEEEGRSCSGHFPLASDPLVQLGVDMQGRLKLHRIQMQEFERKASEFQLRNNLKARSSFARPWHATHIQGRARSRFKAFG